MKTVLYVIVDGMTETEAVNSSLSQAITPNMDWVAEEGEIGFYLPEKEPEANEPKTDVVIPAFFDFPVSMNPGRVGLELLDLNIKLIPGSFCFSCRVTPPNSADNLDWRKFIVVNPIVLIQLESRLRSLATKYGAVCTRSMASNYGDCFLFGNCHASSYRDLCEEVAACLSSFSLTPFVGNIHQVPSSLYLVEGIRKDLVFLGWAKGSLRGAFRFLGASCNPFTREQASYFNWESYWRNFSSWARPYLQQCNLMGKTFVLYTKETAFASRQGSREMKIRGIEFMDRMLGEIQRLLVGEVTIVMLSDHSCNIGGYDNPTSNTLYAYARVSGGTLIQNKLMRRHFCESAVDQKQSIQITQLALVQKISMFRYDFHLHGPSANNRFIVPSVI